jgi:choline-sulfatase
MPPSLPNILLIMSDEHAPQYSATYGHPIVKTPNMDRLANMGTTFENTYCNSPLCGPSRMSFMTGRYIHHINAYDNAMPLPSDTITWPHLLRSAGYDVVLSGKQHFVGPDQLHGFEEQLSRDLHSELWTKNGIHSGTPDWTKGIVDAKQPWGGLAKAGPGHTTEIEVDDHVEETTLTYLRDPARKNKPWCINASFIAPHFPLVAPQRFWDLYPLDEIDLPEIPSGHLENQHPVYQRMRRMFGCADFPEELVRIGRAGYYALITYLDEKIGRLIDCLEETGQLENTLIIHTSDHGEMNGEHGMWRKSNFYDASARIPLQISWPGVIPQNKRVDEVVSLVDLIATLADVTETENKAPLDGHSLLPLMTSGDPTWKDEAFSEYLAHGVTRPMAMLRQGDFKFNYSLGDLPELYDLANDPDEFHNLAQDPIHQTRVNTMQTHLLSHWDAEPIEQDILQSQSERLFIEQSVGNRK